MSNLTSSLNKSNLFKTFVLSVAILSSPFANATDSRFSQNFNKLIMQDILLKPVGYRSLQVQANHAQKIKNTPVPYIDNKVPSRFQAKNRKITTKKQIKKKNNDSQVLTDFVKIYTKRQELASMHAVSEVCLELLPKKQHAKFNKAFQIELKQLFPNIENPQLAMKYLSNRKDYKSLVNDWKTKYSDKENKALCNEMVNELK